MFEDEGSGVEQVGNGHINGVLQWFVVGYAYVVFSAA
jgi:hypothetical protein